MIVWNLLGQGTYHPPTRLVLGNLAAWSHGASVVYPSAVFDPKAIVDALVQEGCTALHGVPTHFLGVLDEFDKRKGAGERLDISRLRSASLQHFSISVGLEQSSTPCRTGIAAGSPIPIDMMKSLIDKLNLVDLTNAYGMSTFSSFGEPDSV